MKKEELVFLSIIFLMVLMPFIFAAPSAPTNLFASGNTTAVYDEGNFSINWTAGTDAKNYSVYIFVNGTTFYKKDWNNSVTGYSFNNWTEANYTFKIGTVNSTGTEVNSTENVSIYVDRTPPVITLPVYTNATAKKNSATLTINISVADASSGVTGTLCSIDVNGTNQTIALASGWCNGTVALTGLSDGNATIKVYANDTVNILGENNSFVVLVDTTAPIISVTCSPSSVSTGETFPCSCSGTDATAGINSSLTSDSTTSPEGVSVSPSLTGTFTYTCSITDYAGNSNSGTAIYSVSLPPSYRGGSGGGGNSPTTSFYVKSIPQTSKDLSEIQTIKTSSFNGGGLAVKEKVTFKLNNEQHYLGIKALSTSSVKIEVASQPVEVDMNIGDEKKVDLDNDGYYDIKVVLNGIANSKADLTMSYIHELIFVSSPNLEETTGEEEQQENLNLNEETEEQPSGFLGLSSTAWIITIVAVILVIFVIITLPKKRKK